MSEYKFLRNVRNGCNDEVQFCKKNVYHKYCVGETYDILGFKLEKDEWIKNNIENPEYEEDVTIMLKDWELYKNGWLINGIENVALYYYLAQLGRSSRPKELSHIKGYRKLNN